MLLLERARLQCRVVLLLLRLAVLDCFPWVGNLLGAHAFSFNRPLVNPRLKYLCRWCHWFLLQEEEEHQLFSRRE
jgi:hypothetical protein